MFISLRPNPVPVPVYTYIYIYIHPVATRSFVRSLAAMGTAREVLDFIRSSVGGEGGGPGEKRLAATGITNKLAAAAVRRRKGTERSEESVAGRAIASGGANVGRKGHISAIASSGGTGAQILLRHPTAQQLARLPGPAHCCFFYGTTYAPAAIQCARCYVYTRRK